MRLLLALALLLLATGCERGAADQHVIAVLSGDGDSALAQDPAASAFRERVQARCPGCVVLERQADGDVATQLDQLDEVVERGADVVLLDPVGVESGESMVLAAGAVTVVSTGTFVPGSDLHVGYDVAATGDALGRTVPRGSRVLVVDAPRSDPDGVEVDTALDARLADRDVDVVEELQPVTDDEVVDWVGEQVEAADVDAVVIAGDGAEVSGALADLPEDRRPDLYATGSDLPTLRRIVAAVQAGTVHLPARTLGVRTADAALALVAGREVAGVQDVEGVPSVLLVPRGVTLDSLTDRVVRDGTVTLDQLCAGLGARCSALGLQ